MLSSECKYEFVYCLFAELACCMVPENMSWYVVNCLYSVVVLSGTVSMRQNVVCFLSFNGMWPNNCEFDLVGILQLYGYEQ